MLHEESGAHDGVNTFLQRGINGGLTFVDAILRCEATLNDLAKFICFPLPNLIILAETDMTVEETCIHERRRRPSVRCGGKSSREVFFRPEWMQKCWTAYPKVASEIRQLGVADNRANGKRDKHVRMTNDEPNPVLLAIHCIYHSNTPVHVAGYPLLTNHRGDRTSNNNA